MWGVTCVQSRWLQQGRKQRSRDEDGGASTNDMGGDEGTKREGSSVISGLGCSSMESGSGDLASTGSRGEGDRVGGESSSNGRRVGRGTRYEGSGDESGDESCGDDKGVGGRSEGKSVGRGSSSDSEQGDDVA